MPFITSPHAKTSAFVGLQPFSDLYSLRHNPFFSTYRANECHGLVEHFAKMVRRADTNKSFRF